jgi:hypothetical protein
VNPHARLVPIDPGKVDGGPAVRAWEVVIDPSVEPLAEPPLTPLVRGSELGRFSQRPVRQPARGEQA